MSPFETDMLEMFSTMETQINNLDMNNNKLTFIDRLAQYLESQDNPIIATYAYDIASAIQYDVNEDGLQSEIYSKCEELFFNVLYKTLKILLTRFPRMSILGLIANAQQMAFTFNL